MIGSANDVVDDHDRSRFVLEQAGSTAELVYRNEPGRLIRINTDVPDPFAGRGIGGRLVQAAIERAKTEGLTIVPWCLFARTWLTEHPDAVGGIDIDAAMPSNGQAPMAEAALTSSPSTRTPCPRAPGARTAHQSEDDGCTCGCACTVATSAAATALPTGTPPPTARPPDHPVIRSYEPTRTVGVATRLALAMAARRAGAPAVA
jgi:predicted GNAT family acetyltransferase